MSTVIRRVEEVLGLPRHYDPIWRETWAEEAPDILLPASNQEIGKVALMSCELLLKFPYEETGATALRANEGQGVLKEVRGRRKTLVVGRDAFNMVNEAGISSSPDTRPVKRFTTTLGKVADTHGNSKALRIRAFRESKAAKRASRHIDGDFISPVSPEELRLRFTSALKWIY